MPSKQVQDKTSEKGEIKTLRDLQEAFKRGDLIERSEKDTTIEEGLHYLVEKGTNKRKYFFTDKLQIKIYLTVRPSSFDLEKLEKKDEVQYELIPIARFKEMTGSDEE